MIENNEYDFDQFLSFLDLEKLDDWEEAFKGQNEELFNKVLYTNGADLDYGWKIEYVLHRPRTSNFVEYGPVVRFRERRDKEYEPYRDVRDIARTDPSSTVRAGMVESLNAGITLNDAIEERLSIHTKYLKMRSEEKQQSKEKE